MKKHYSHRRKRSFKWELFWLVADIFMIALLFSAFLFLNVRDHEVVHWRIYRLYGVDSKIDFPFKAEGTAFVYGYTTANGSQYYDLPFEQREELDYLHHLNEIHNPISYGDLFFKSVVTWVLVWKLPKEFSYS